ncbi:hypothetical protein C2845_PM09G12780 [Panicum miliaceum]|uniref:Uncharacterized protein n=1 Tax=Panicum miliaceum TaxID=4540 RepID=A0A3L6S2S0_PANMI|nr:hypothetical protein C2845_PM09G12780 [Panicum miliaceum]
MKEIIWERVVKAGLSGATLFYTMCEWRVMPLAEQRKQMWLYYGPSDPDQVFVEELPEDEVWSWLLMVLKGADKDDIGGLTPFDCKNPPNLGLVHPRSRPRLPGGPESRAKQIAQEEAAQEKKKKKGDRVAKR